MLNRKFACRWRCRDSCVVGLVACGEVGCVRAPRLDSSVVSSPRLFFVAPRARVLCVRPRRGPCDVSSIDPPQIEIRTRHRVSNNPQRSSRIHARAILSKACTAVERALSRAQNPFPLVPLISTEHLVSLRPLERALSIQLHCPQLALDLRPRLPRNSPGPLTASDCSSSVRAEHRLSPCHFLTQTGGNETVTAPVPPAAAMPHDVATVDARRVVTRSAAAADRDTASGRHGMNHDQ